LAAVAERLARELRPSVIDLNFGCPAPDVAGKAQSGAYLLRWPQRVETLVRRVVAAAAPLPVTAKLRLGWDAQTINAAEVAQAVEAAGGAAVTIHGRTAAELYRGKADWERIAAVKPYLRHIPLIGNGDLKTPQDVVRAFERYSVDGVMIGRAALGQPWLFREVRAALRDQPISSPPDDVQQCEIILRHYSLLAQQFGPRKATVLMRKHACRYVSGRAGARAFRERLGRVSSPRQLVELLGGPWP
jgi:tRNA-dihydrouridine synthase B